MYTHAHTRVHTQYRISTIDNLFLSVSTGNVRRLSESFNGTGSQKDGIFYEQGSLVKQLPIKE